MTGFVGPQTFAIDSSGKFYISDVINCRINIYDKDFSFLRHIDNSNIKEQLYFTYKINVNSQSDIIIYSDGYGLLKIDKDGKLLFYKKNSELPSNIVGGYDFFKLDNIVLLYDKDNNKIKMIDDTGKIITLKQYLDNKNETPTDKTRSDNILVKEGIVLFDNKILSDLLNDHLNEKIQMTIDSTSVKYTRNSYQIEDLSRYEPASFIGFDDEGNSYWNSRIDRDRTKKVILILANSGKVLDCFYNKIIQSIISISPNGDVYFLDYNNRGAKLYKTSRNW